MWESPVKSLEKVNNLLDVVVQSLGFGRAASDKAQKAKTDLLIEPNISDYSSFDFDKVKELIKTGERAAWNMLPQLRELADSVKTANRIIKKPFTDFPKQVLIKNIYINGGNSYLRKMIRASLPIRESQMITTGKLATEIKSISGSNRIENLHYRLIPKAQNNGYELNINITAANINKVGLGARYDSHYKASLLLNGSFGNLLSSGDELQADIRLGEQRQVRTNYLLPYALKPEAWINISAAFSQSPFDIYMRNERVASLEDELVSLDAQTGLKLFNNFSLAAGLHGEIFDYNQSIGQINRYDTHDTKLLSGSISLYENSLDQSYFPSRGTKLLVKTTVTDKQLGSDFSFSQFIANFEGHLPVGKRLSFSSQITAGRTIQRGDQIPLHDQFFSGGALPISLFKERQFPLWGYRVQQLRGLNLVSIAGGTQLQLRDEIYVRLRWNAARLANQWDWKIDGNDFNSGFGLSVGKKTILGPLQLIFTSRGLDEGLADLWENALLRLNIGYSF